MSSYSCHLAVQRCPSKGSHIKVQTKKIQQLKSPRSTHNLRLILTNHCVQSYVIYALQLRWPVRITLDLFISSGLFSWITLKPYWRIRTQFK